MGRVKGTMHTCDVCGHQHFIDDTVNTEAGVNACGWYFVMHLGVRRELCFTCYDEWNVLNRNFLKITEEVK